MHLGQQYVILVVSLLLMSTVNGIPLLPIAIAGGRLLLGALLRRRARPNPGVSIYAPNPTFNTFYGGEFDGYPLGGGQAALIEMID